jgi:rhodanese-related sulfurtransferase
MSEANAAPVCIEEGVVSLTIDTPYGPIEISRVPDDRHRLTDEWARTSRPAPPAVLQPLLPVAGVVPLGELELMEALLSPDIVVADGRKPEQYAQYTIPGAINLPFNDIEHGLEYLGCRGGINGWDCHDAAHVALFCNGVWCGQSPTAIRRMVAAGFPAERILYYRNGLQGWLLQGLSIWVPGKTKSFHL